jgi:hypothetical protein
VTYIVRLVRIDKFMGEESIFYGPIDSEHQATLLAEVYSRSDGQEAYVEELRPSLFREIR